MAEQKEEIENNNSLFNRNYNKQLNKAGKPDNQIKKNYQDMTASLIKQTLNQGLIKSMNN